MSFLISSSHSSSIFLHFFQFITILVLIWIVRCCYLLILLDSALVAADSCLMQRFVVELCLIRIDFTLQYSFFIISERMDKSLRLPGNCFTKDIRALDTEYGTLHIKVATFIEQKTRISFVPIQYVKQVKLPSTGGRLIIASNGIWDALSSEMVATSCRGLPAELVACQIVKGYALLCVGFPSSDLEIKTQDEDW